MAARGTSKTPKKSSETRKDPEVSTKMVGSKRTTKAEDSDEPYLSQISVHSGDRTSSVLAARELRAFGQELGKMVSDFPFSFHPS